MTILTKRFEFSSNKFVNPEKWSNEGSKVKGSSEETRSINNHLDNLKSKVLEDEKKLFKIDIVLTSENLKTELLGTQERARTIILIFQDHNNKIKELVGKEYATGTLER